jgi:hypothetical protein
MEDITGGGHDEGHGLGDKIIWSYMRAMVADLDESPCPLKPWITYPFRVDQFLQTSLPDDLCSTWKASYQRSSGSIYVICEYHGHWFLLVGCCNELKDGIYWTLHDGLRQGHQLTTFSLVAKKLSGILDLDFVDLHMGNGLLQAHPSTCGTVALVQMALDLRLTAPETDWNLLPLHQWLLSHQPASCIIARGPGLPAELQTKLTTLLQQHGVPATEVSERTKLVTQKLGVAAIQEAFAAKNCWAYLKAIASRPSISLRLVLPDELSKHVAATSTTRFGAHVANAKGKKKQKPDHKATPANIILDPEQLVLTHTSFRDPDDDVVQQIPFSAVEAEATGIAICNLAQGCHFIQTKQSISSKPLAILLTERPPQAFMDEHDVRAISFAAKYTGTGEPVLVFGALKNLGDIKINQHVPGIHEQPALVDTQVIKVQVFRDEFLVRGNSWPNHQCERCAKLFHVYNYARAKTVAMIAQNLTLRWMKNWTPSCLKYGHAASLSSRVARYLPQMHKSLESFSGFLPQSWMRSCNLRHLASTLSPDLQRPKDMMSATESSGSLRDPLMKLPIHAVHMFMLLDLSG